MTLRLVAALLGALLAAAGPCHAESPQRVVTVNLCLDQLALRLAAPGQLVGVSYLSRDPRLSVMVDRAREVAVVRGTAESILELKPDLVVFDSASHANVKRLVRGAGVPILELPWAASLEEAEGLIGKLSAALGRGAEGHALISRMREERRTLSWSGQPTVTAAALQGNLGTTGAGTLMGDLLRLTGYRNLAAELGIEGYGRLSLEALLAGRPDVLVFDGEANLHPARATAFVDHAAIRNLSSHTRIVSLPIRYSVCAGPENLQAMRLLREAHP